MILKPPKGALLKRGHISNRGLVGYWLLNEGGGARINDLSGYGNHGTITGATWAAGKFGPCLSFNGTSAKIALSSLDALRTTAYTISVWAKRSTITAAWGGLISLQANELELWVYENGDIGFGQTSYNWKKWSTVWTDKSSWHHIAVVVPASGTATLYFDTVTKGSVSPQTNAAWTSPAIGLVYPSLSCYYAGLIDSLQICNRALAASEIQELYRNPFRGIQRTCLELFAGAMGGGANPALVTNDSLTLSESVVTQINPLIASTTDSLTVSESTVVQTTPLLATVQESVTLSETVSQVVTPLLAVSGDSFALSESAVTQINPLIASVADAVTVSESATVQVTPLLVTAADSLTLLDTVGAALDHFESVVADALTLSETITVGTSGAFEATAEEAATLSDAVVAQITPLEIAVVDAVTISDTTTCEMPQTGALAVDTMTLSESVATALSPLLVSAQDNVALSDTVSLERYPFDVEISETLALSDSVTAVTAGAGAALSFFLIKHHR
jgi:hypothetical protein